MLILYDYIAYTNPIIPREKSYLDGIMPTFKEGALNDISLTPLTILAY